MDRLSAPVGSHQPRRLRAVFCSHHGGAITLVKRLQKEGKKPMGFCRGNWAIRSANHSVARAYRGVLCSLWCGRWWRAWQCGATPCVQEVSSPVRLASPRSKSSETRTDTIIFHRRAFAEPEEPLAAAAASWNCMAVSAEVADECEVGE